MFGCASDSKVSLLRTDEFADLRRQKSELIWGRRPFKSASVGDFW